VQRKSHHHLLTKYIFPLFGFITRTLSLLHLFPVNSRCFNMLENISYRERERERERVMVIKFASSIGERVPNNPYREILEEGKASLAKREEKSQEYDS